MIRFSPMTFVRHAGGKSLLWRPRTGACVVADGAEPFLFCAYHKQCARFRQASKWTKPGDTVILFSYLSSYVFFFSVFLWEK